MKNKWTATGVSICDRTVGNWLNGIGFPYRKDEPKLVLRSKEKRTRLHWPTEKQSWSADDLMKMVFNDESWIYICQGDDGETFVWCNSNETCQNECLKKTRTFTNTFMTYCCLSDKLPRKLLSQQSIHKYTMKFWRIFFLINLPPSKAIMSLKYKGLLGEK